MAPSNEYEYNSQTIIKSNDFDFWPPTSKTFLVMPTQTMNISVRFHWV